MSHRTVPTLTARLIRLAAAASLAIGSLAAFAQSIVVASTTSTEQSGLFGHILPAFTKRTGVEVRVVALGTGQALDIGRRGDADVVFVHDEAAEEKFVAEGFGLARRKVMYNDFVLTGPIADPVGVRGGDIVAALRKIAAADAPFISRGDKSGTHAAELRYWDAAADSGQADSDQAGSNQTGADPRGTRKDTGHQGYGHRGSGDSTLAQQVAPPKGAGYKECGCGMGPALNMAASTGAYVLADRGTWLSFKNRASLAVLVQGDTRLFNQYGAIVVNPARHPHVKAAAAQAFVDWLISDDGQAAIAAYKIDGEQLFFPNADD